MNILGGRYRGRRLEVPPVSGVRPTLARVRKSVFDLLTHSSRLTGSWDETSVLDLFAGAGTLGIEALSRGAAYVTFVERDPVVAAALTHNIIAIGEGSRARILRTNALELPTAPTAAGLVFVDAPYGAGLAAPALGAAREAAWVAAGSLAVVELDSRDGFEAPSGYVIIDERRYGTTRIVLLRA